MLYHPSYDDDSSEWYKWRLAYQGGRQFRNQYLQQFSNREDDADFRQRIELTPVPRHAGAAIDEVKNSIYQRLVDITREGGTVSYRDCIDGMNDGVDLLGSSMTFFIGRHILLELLLMRKVGIYVDMPSDQLTTMSDVLSVHRPYLYVYKIENICNWAYDEGPNSNQFRSLLLKECQYKIDDNTGLPIDYIEYYKLFYKEGNEVYVKVINNDKDINEVIPIKLNIPRIPFVVLELSRSLMQDIADYQIALLNMGSADINYGVRSNFPLYVEQRDVRVDSPYSKDTQTKKDVEIGPSKGRAYPKDMNQPAFIAPPPDPLKVSMEKQEQLKTDIRLLLNLTLSNLSPKQASAQSKGMDERTLESGLSYIGLELQYGEQEIAQIWSMYENSKDVAIIKYPDRYDLKSDETRIEQATSLAELIPSVPSNTYRKEISKRVTGILLNNRIPQATLDKIYKEIDQADITATNPEILSKDVEQGLLSLESAAVAKGYPKDEPKKAAKDHVERLKRIKETQSPDIGPNGQARGVPELGSSGDGKEEKQQSQGFDSKTEQPIPTNRVRGK